MPPSIKTPLGCQSKLRHQTLSIEMQPDRKKELWHPENLACVWIFHSGPSDKSADIDVICLG